MKHRDDNDDERERRALERIASGETRPRRRARRGPGKDRRRPNATIRFAYFDLAAGEALTGHVHRAETAGQPVLGTVARIYGMHEASMTIRINAARLQGLVEMTDGRLRTTPLGRELLDPATRDAAVTKAFLAVPLNARLVETYRGPVGPRRDGEDHDLLDSHLAAAGVPPKSIDDARKAFVSSAGTARWDGTGSPPGSGPATEDATPGAAAAQGIAAQGIDAEGIAAEDAVDEAEGHDGPEARGSGPAGAGRAAEQEHAMHEQHTNGLDHDYDPAAPELFTPPREEVPRAPAREEGAPEDGGGSELAYKKVPAPTRDDRAIAGGAAVSTGVADAGDGDRDDGDGGGEGGGRRYTPKSAVAKIPRRTLGQCMAEILSPLRGGLPRDELFEKVRIGRNGAIQDPTIANWLNYSLYFGLVALAAKGGRTMVEPTAIGRDAISVDDATCRRAKMRAFRNVDLYRAVLALHVHPVGPPTAADPELETTLLGLQVGCGVVGRVRQILATTALEAGAIAAFGQRLRDPFPEDASGLAPLVIGGIVIAAKETVAADEAVEAVPRTGPDAADDAAAAQAAPVGREPVPAQPPAPETAPSPPAAPSPPEAPSPLAALGEAVRGLMPLPAERDFQRRYAAWIALAGAMAAFAETVGD